jgi:hypothetical protein
MRRGVTRYGDTEVSVEGAISVFRVEMALLRKTIQAMYVQQKS